MKTTSLERPLLEAFLLHFFVCRPLFYAFGKRSAALDSQNLFSATNFQSSHATFDLLNEVPLAVLTLKIRLCQIGILVPVIF